MDNLFSDESVGALRRLLEHYKEIECRHWRTVHRRIQVPEYKLKKFVSGERVPSVAVLSVIYEHLLAFTINRENANSPVLVVAQAECDLLFKLRTNRDQYAALKKLANLLDEEQRLLSEKTEGTYLTVRRQRDGGYFLSHMIIYDSFGNHGLPTCRISRLRRDEAGNPEGDLVIDGALFIKNRNLSIVGYDRDAGDLRTVSLKIIDGSLEKFKGFASGYELSGTAFSAKIIIQKFPKHFSYKSIRELTGLFSGGQDEVGKIIEELFGEGSDLLERIKVLQNDSYLDVSEAL